MDNEQRTYDLLGRLGIPYERIGHPAVYTCGEAAKYDAPDAAQVKNLFLTNASRTGYFLVVMDAAKKLRAKQLGRALGEKGLTFASPDEMLRILGLEPGAVSPFALVNDGAGEVAVVLDRTVAESRKVSFHPCVNTASLVLAACDFLKALESFPNRVLILEL